MSRMEKASWEHVFVLGYAQIPYTFTLAKTSRVRLEFQNWWSDQARWGLSNGDGLHSYFSETVYASYPGTDTVVCYLKPGAYRLEVYSMYSGSGYFKVRGTASVTSYPLRDNDKAEKAVTMKKGTTYKGLFTLGDAWQTYYKFTVSGTRKVNIDVQQPGTTGEGKRLEAIQIKLTGAMSRAYDVYYRVHAQMLGWMGWAKNGASAGTAGHAYRLEAIQIVLVPKGGAAPGATYKGVTQNYARPFLQP